MQKKTKINTKRKNAKLRPIKTKKMVFISEIVHVIAFSLALFLQSKIKLGKSIFFSFIISLIRFIRAFPVRFKEYLSNKQIAP